MWLNVLKQSLKRTRFLLNITCNKHYLLPKELNRKPLSNHFCVKHFLAQANKENNLTTLLDIPKQHETNISLKPE